MWLIPDVDKEQELFEDRRARRLETLTHHRHLRAIKVLLGEASDVERGTLHAIEKEIADQLGYLPMLVVTVRNPEGTPLDEFSVFGPTTTPELDGVLAYWPKGSQIAVRSEDGIEFDDETEEE